MVVNAGTGKAYQSLVVIAQSFEESSHLHLAHCLRKVVFLLEADLLRHIRVEFVERTYSYDVEHFLYLTFRVRKILVFHIIENEESYKTYRSLSELPSRRTQRMPQRP